MTETTAAFLKRYGMLNPDFDIMTCARDMCQDMVRGLGGEPSSYQMIPTYLTAEGSIPSGKPVVVIDAGGTNFRSALVHFENGHCIEERVRKTGMPGIGLPATWDTFIRFTADQIEDLMEFTDRIGFCFSYSAEITPEIDGRVICIDKEVVITDCEGKLVGASLIEELARRGYHGKKVAVLNDTAAVQLGGIAKHLHDDYIGRFGQVSGTGTNTCCSVCGENIKKLGQNAYGMIINMESGMYNGLKQGYFDKQLDQESHNPGQKHFEKMTAGVYLGELCRLMLKKAAEDGILSQSCAERVKQLDRIESWMADAWAIGNEMNDLTEEKEDKQFIADIARFLFERSAEFMCANLTGMALLTDAGHSEKCAIYAEGSLIQKNHIYRPHLESLLKHYLNDRLGRQISLLVEEDTTLPGAAVAALLNIG